MTGKPDDWMAQGVTGWLMDDVCRLSISLETGSLYHVGVRGDVPGNVLLTRLKQHDHPLSFLSVSIYRHALHPKPPRRRLNLKDYKPRKKKAILKRVNNGNIVLNSFFCIK